MLIKKLPCQKIDSMRSRFNRLYGPHTSEHCVERIAALCGRYGVGYNPAPEKEKWNEKTAVLITYADSLVREGEKPLVTLRNFTETNLKNTVSTIHLLPFFPWSSDDGFSVIDYRRVSETYGRWKDVREIGSRFEMMFDLVLNHVSRSGIWFKNYIEQIAPYRSYFIEADPRRDWSAVVRPRSLPLLTAVHWNGGKRHLWTTFGEDQIDLNFSNPDVLFEFLDILLFYISQGASVIRLDAVAYLWKQPGTSCIHLEQTHEIIRLMRDLLDVVAPDVVLLTETNVPHEENISYFGKGDEAHMVYQFSLPPLLLHALHSETGRYLTEWAKTVCETPPGCTWFNFTASHDGIGVRPLTGLLPDKEIHHLAETIKRLGGKISTRRNPDGTDSPYELNCSWFDALGGDGFQVDRFLCSQTVMLGLKGVPALYFHSLTATPNDLEGIKASGQARSINRKKWDAETLEKLLAGKTTPAFVFSELKNRLQIRRKQPAFHPDAAQQILDLGGSLFGFVRTAPDKTNVICISNLSSNPQEIPAAEPLSCIHNTGPCTDLLTGTRYNGSPKHIRLDPFQTAWLTSQAG